MKLSSAKYFDLRKLFQYFLPTTLTLFMLVTVERSVHGDIGLYEKLYGLPFPYISSNYAFTHHYDIYIVPLLLDLLLYFVVTFLIFIAVQKIGITLRTHWTFIVVGIIICLFWLFFFVLISFESTFKLTNDFEYQTTQSHLFFGSFP